MRRVPPTVRQRIASTPPCKPVGVDDDATGPSSGSAPEPAPGPLLASGRAADVYDVGDGRVLRRYRTDGHDVEYEASVMRLVRDAGVNVPEVHHVGARDIVMERVDGPTMFESLSAAPWKGLWHMRVLSSLQKKIAKVDAPPWMLASTADRSHRQSVLHLDLHPMNVILSQRHGPMVIDWTNAAGGPAGFDAATSYVLMATFSVDSPRDKAAQRVMVEAFRTGRGRSVIDPFLVAACDHRLADPNTTVDERIAVGELRSRASRE